MDWKSQIEGIILETERNLGGRGAMAHRLTMPPLYKPPRVAVAAANAAFNQSAAAAARPAAPPPPRAPPVQMPPMPPVPPAAPPPAHAPPPSMPPPPGGLSAGASTSNVVETLLDVDARDGSPFQRRLVEVLKYELDARMSVTHSQLDAVREELAYGLQDVERKALDLASKIQVAVTSAMDGEREQRGLSDKQLARVEAALVDTRRETFGLIDDVQSTSLDLSEVCRRLEKDLAAFKLDTETKLVEEQNRSAGLIEREKQLRLTTELASAEATVARVNEVEVALLKEREFRKEMEGEISALSERHEMVPTLVDAAVRRELDASGAGGHASAVSALDEKVTPRVLPPRVAARASIATARHGHAYPITRIFRCASAAGSSCAWAEI